jgi:hypothetical protein
VSNFGEEVDDPKSDFWREEFGRSQTFDLGNRDAIFEMVIALRNQAKRQFFRSKCTLNNPFANEHDKEDNDWDAQVYYVLLTLVDARYVSLKKRPQLPEDREPK